MKPSLAALGTAILLVISNSWAGEPTTLGDFKKSDVWRLLFYGKSSAGWVEIGEADNHGIKKNVVDPLRNLGVECQLLDDARHPDGIKGGALHETGAPHELIAPDPSKKFSSETGCSDLQQAIARGKYKVPPQLEFKNPRPCFVRITATTLRSGPRN